MKVNGIWKVYKHGVTDVLDLGLCPVQRAACEMFGATPFRDFTARDAFGKLVAWPREDL